VQWHRCCDRMDACDGIELLGVLAAARISTRSELAAQAAAQDLAAR